MSGEDGAAVDDDIGTGNATATTVGVLAALKADTVVAGIELGIDDKGVGIRLQIEGIASLGEGGVTGEYSL